MSIPYGFVSLEDGGCLVAHSCGSTWGTYEACCPPNSICQGPSKSVCYDTNDRNCTNVLLSKPKCANETWTLYGPDQQEHFCCRPGTVGYKAGIGRWSGCAGHGYKFEVNDRALVPVVAASVSTTHSFIDPGSFSLSIPASPTATSTTTRPASKSRWNKKGIIGVSVVGASFLLFFLIACLVVPWIKRRRQKRRRLGGLAKTFFELGDWNRSGGQGEGSSGSGLVNNRRGRGSTERELDTIPE